MSAFKHPTFQDRTAAAAKAKQKALDQLKAKPPIDEAVIAERQRAHEARELALAEKRSIKAAATAAEKAERAEKAAAKAAERAAEEAAAALKAARLKPATAAEMKAARDARFAARKARK